MLQLQGVQALEPVYLLTDPYLNAFRRYAHRFALFILLNPPSLPLPAVAWRSRMRLFLRNSVSHTIGTRSAQQRGTVRIYPKVLRLHEFRGESSFQGCTASCLHPLSLFALEAASWARYAHDIYYVLIALDPPQGVH